ncbi:MAG: phosphoenolpyruvate carboxylase [Aigarchaeota archaeon]|nr:phosphoenolpyruvate carboxylase [Candidatus Geocrenenecus dongiae]
MELALLGGFILREERRPPTNTGGIMFKNVVLPAGLSPEPVKRTSLLWLEGSLLPGTPRYTPAWEKIGSIVSRALDEYEDEEGFVEYLDNQYF